MVREMQHNDPNGTEENVIQNVAAKSAMEIYSDPQYASNTQLQRDLRKDGAIPRKGKLQYRGEDGTTKLVSLEQAYKLKSGSNKSGRVQSIATAKVSITGQGKKSAMPSSQPAAAAKSSYVPTNSTFISNKNKDYTAPPGISAIPNSSNRKVRNNLSEKPMEYHRMDDVIAESR